MSDLEVTLEETGNKGRYAYRADDTGEEAEITFSRVSPTRIIVDHTGVPDSMRGQGVGAKLAAFVVADARAKGERIIPLCPFFKAQAQRHPEWSDVVEL